MNLVLTFETVSEFKNYVATLKDLTILAGREWVPSEHTVYMDYKSATELAASDDWPQHEAEMFYVDLEFYGVHVVFSTKKDGVVMPSMKEFADRQLRIAYAKENNDRLNAPPTESS